MTLDRAVALIAAHLGVIDEGQINNMSYVFFEDVLEELGHKLQYDAIVNYAGNSFCEKSSEMIADYNPFNVGNKKNGVMKNLASFFGGANVRIGKPKVSQKKKNK